MQPITVKITIKAPIEKIWQYWTVPEHIMQWAFASADWHAPAATNDIKTGGKFVTTMAAKDGSASFDFTGTYTNVEEFKKIEYIMEDGRKVSIDFIPENEGYSIVETFDPENQNPIEMQQAGWQAILDNFKSHVMNS